MASRAIFLNRCRKEEKKCTTRKIRFLKCGNVWEPSKNSFDCISNVIIYIYIVKRKKRESCVHR